MPDFLAWFELRSDHGRDYADNLEPIAELAITLNLPRRVGGDILPTGTQVCTIKPAEQLDDELLVRVIPGTRIVETSSMLAAQSLAALAIFEQIEKPTTKVIAAARSETAAHHDAIAKYEDLVSAGDVPAPDASDPTPPVAMPGVVSVAFTADERLALDNAIAAGEIDHDERFAVWVAATPIDDLLTAIGDDELLAKRVLIAEEDRADARKGLVQKLRAALINTTPEG